MYISQQNLGKCLPGEERETFAELKSKQGYFTGEVWRGKKKGKLQQNKMKCI